MLINVIYYFKTIVIDFILLDPETVIKIYYTLNLGIFCQ